MHQNKIIGLVGYPGSGKSTLISLLGKNGYNVFDNGRALRMFLDGTYSNYSLTEKIHNLTHSGSMLSHIISEIEVAFKEGGRSIMFMDSFKTINDPKVLKKHFKKIHIQTLAVLCPYGTRQERVIKRARERDNAPVIQRDAELKQLGIDSLIKSAEYRIETDCSFNEMHKRLKKLLTIMES
ncbi:hypothetical protein [Flagellimonas sp.]|uniref:hypothetical protein n=1 Tax=Flagellimonas sp. TaxID=2058762 RepID=UPI003BB1E560